MRLPRLGDAADDRLLEEAATTALATGEKIVVLTTLKAAKGLDVRQAGMILQKRGYGRLIEIAGGGEREYHFSLTTMGYDFAADVRAARRARSLRGRVANVNWNAMNAIAASVAAVAAVIAAYYSYLSFVSEHAQTH